MNAQKPDALRLADALAYWDSSVASQAARELRRLHAENEALQQVYDARQLEIDHLRGVTKSKLLAQPVAWMVYLPSIDTQHLYYSQEDMGYVDDVTNHADAEVTPLYEMAPPKAEVAPAGEYPPSVAYTELPDFDTVEQRIYAGCRRFISRDMLEPIHGLIREAIDADRAARAPADSGAAPAGGATSKNPLQVQVWVIPDGNGGGQFSWEKQDERYWTLLTPAAQAAESVLEDSARLDWLESNSQINIERVRYLGATKSIYEVTPYNSISYDGETLRDAINAAMAAARKKGENHD